MNLPKLVVTDIDGVWTDGGMYYDEHGNEWKKFHTYDSAGVLFLKQLGIPVVICTGESTNSVRRRSEKLNVDFLYLGADNKLDIITSLCRELSLELSQVAFIGDDLKDIALLEKVGFSACPSSAPEYVKSIVHLVLRKKGGEGAFREFVEFLLKDRLEEILQAYKNLPGNEPMTFSQG